MMNKNQNIRHRGVIIASILGLNLSALAGVDSGGHLRYPTIPGNFAYSCKAELGSSGNKVWRRHTFTFENNLPKFMPGLDSWVPLNQWEAFDIETHLSATPEQIAKEAFPFKEFKVYYRMDRSLSAEGIKGKVILEVHKGAVSSEIFAETEGSYNDKHIVSSGVYREFEDGANYFETFKSFGLTVDCERTK